MTTIYSLEDIKSHNSKKSLWVTINNKVYDITAFVQEHPGGEEVLLDEAGGDATEAFEDIGHSEDARQILEKHLIGVLDKPTQNTQRKVLVLPDTPVPKTKSSSNAYILVPLLAVVGALAYAFAF